MDHSNVFARKPLMVAFAISFLLHAAVLFFRIVKPEPVFPAVENSDEPSRPRLEIALAQPYSPPVNQPSSRPPADPAPSVESGRKPRRPSEKTPPRRTTGADADLWANKSWSKAERADMDKFLSELAAPAKPSTGREMAKNALQTAREIARQPLGVEEGGAAIQQSAKGKVIEPFSMTMYFDAFVRKLNRSAAFVKKEPRGQGVGKALVQISLNQDGSLKSFRILRADDLQAEIAYIKSVIDRASPFSAFPPDIREATDSLSILMCILPASAGGGGFSRSLSGQDC
jgi:GNAT superfamily N-acetyltransferase